MRGEGLGCGKAKGKRTERKKNSERTEYDAQMIRKKK